MPNDKMGKDKDMEFASSRAIAPDGQPTRIVTLGEVYDASLQLSTNILTWFKGRNTLRMYGVPRGGIPCMLMLLATHKGWEGPVPTLLFTEDVSQADIIIDDVYDTGKTEKEYLKYKVPFLVLFDKRNMQWKGQWLVFPWERGRFD